MHPIPQGEWLVARSAAKVNLFLDVLGRRADGYHEIESVMTSVGVCDVVMCRPLAAPQIRVDCQWSAGLLARSSTNDARQLRGECLPQDADNLAGRAVALLRERAAPTHPALSGIEFRIVKSIPSEAGLGGASSNAAAALLLADQIWGLHWPLEDLAEIAAAVGSDVPFFLYGKTAVSRGRGERIEPLARSSRLHLVIVKPPAGLSTASVYQRNAAAADSAETRRSGATLDALLDALRQNDSTRVGRCLWNRLESAAVGLCPVVGEVLSSISKLGLAGAMSGSGTCCFAICRSARHSRAVARTLNAAHPGWVAATTSA